MNRIASASLSLILLLIATTARGTTPPDPGPAAALPETPQAAANPSATPPPNEPFLTRSMVEEAEIDPVIKRDLLRNMRFGDDPVIPEQEPEAEPERASARPPLRIGVQTAVTSTAATVADANEDIEPAIIVNRYSGIDRAIIAYIKYPSPNTFVPSLYWTTTTDWVNFTPAAPLPVPAGYTRCADPMFSQNPYVSSGQNPKRVYLSAVCYHIVDNPDPNADTITSSPVVWWHDNPGNGTPWTAMVLDTLVSTSTMYDKPSTWVSWHTVSRGYVYVAITRKSLISGAGNIYVFLKNASNGSFSLVNSALAGYPISPIVTVDADTGNVYIVWNETTTIKRYIHISRSQDFGGTFPTTVTSSSGTSSESPLYGSGQYGVICDSANANCIKATSVIMARPNAADDSIGVVWHRRETNTAPISQVNTDIWFNSFSLTDQTWRTARRINAVTTGDQWNPALDPNAAGEYMIIWNDKRDDPSDLRYKMYATKVDAQGNRLEANDTLIHSAAVASNPAAYTADNAFVPPRRYLGEYHDIWEWYGTWFTAYIYIPDGSGQGNPYLTRITP